MMGGAYRIRMEIAVRSLSYFWHTVFGCNYVEGVPKVIFDPGE